MEHKDFGEKIGGARKDMRGRFLITDIATLTHIERCKYVRKDMVWPTPDYAALVSEEKMTRQGALMIKMLRDQFPAAPVCSDNISEEAYMHACESYVKVLNAARMVTKCKDEQEISAFLSNDPEFHAMVGRPVSATGSGVFHQAEELSKWKTGGMNFPYTGFRDIARAVTCAHSKTLSYDMDRMSRKNPEWPFGTSRAETTIRKENFTFVKPPGATGFLLSRYSSPISANNSEYYNQRYGTGELTMKPFETKEVGMAALVAAIENFQSSKRKKVAEKRMEVAETRAGDIEERVGPAFREGEVTGQNYLDHFGMRGGEFGLWVNPEERQQVLNKGFDAFKDLADILGFHQGQISMGGDLAIAFGARGTGNAGGSVAAATYEPGRDVINLTKPHGEGCLAHEFAHFFDHQMGRLAKGIQLPVHAELGTIYLSDAQLSETHLSNVAPKDLELAKKLVALNRAMREIISTERETPISELIKSTADRLTTQTERFKTRYVPDLVTQLKHLLRCAEVPIEEADKVALQAEEILNGLADLPKGKNVQFEAGQAVENIRSLVGKRIRIASYRKSVEAATHNIHVYRTQLDYLHSPQAKPIKGRAYTNYYGACSKLDDLFHKTTPYYVKPREMFARTFEASVRDALRDKGRASPFLVSGTNTNAYPVGEEREKFSSAILPLAAEFCRTYKIANPSPTPVQPKSSLQLEAPSAEPNALESTPPPPPPVYRQPEKREENPELEELASRLSVHRQKPVQIDLFL